MEEIEKFLKCPFCFEKISVLIDTSVDAEHSYIEDCEVCCHPILFKFLTSEGKIKNFSYEKAYE